MTAQPMRMAIAGALLLLAAACNKADAPDSANPASYKVQIPVEPAEGGGLQRISLPAQALVAIQRRDHADIRVFDAKGRAMPVALLSRDDLARAKEETVPVPAFPIVGTAGALKLAGVALRLDEDNRARIVGIGGANDTSRSAGPVTVGTLLDTRAIKARAVAIVLDATIPRQQPVTFELDTSTDLKEWKPLAVKVLFRPGESDAVLGSERIAFSPVDLKDRYVRIGWNAQTPLVSPVSVKGAKVVTSTAPPVPDVAVQASAPRGVDAHDWRFVLPFASRLSLVRVTQTANDGIVPVELYGRNGVEAAWTELGGATIRPGQPSAFGNLIAPYREGFTSYRIVADKRTKGFSAPPKLELRLAPVELAVEFDGTPPYTLTAGLRGAPSTYLTANEMSHDGKPVDFSALSNAAAKPSNAAALVVPVTPGAEPGPFSGRRAILWLVLILGVVGLAFAAYKLLRDTPAKD